MATPLTASQLKEAGNALFIKQDYIGAYETYTEAIALDGENAILYANRSACSFKMRKHVDAAADADKATKLDPGYAKGWSRLAAAQDALTEYDESIISWQKALDALPKANLNAAELNQKAQYKAALNAAKLQCVEEFVSPSPVIVVRGYEGKMPWQVAMDMLPELEAAGVMSSAWVIAMAYREFEQGVTHMKQLKKSPIQGDPMNYGMFGHTSGLTCLSNGIMRDVRVFHRRVGNWFDMYNDQVTFEVQRYNAWNLETLDNIIQQAQERQKKNGWDDVRPALAVTVRTWILKSHFEQSVQRSPHIAVELFKRTLDLLEWGHDHWKDVSRSDRGVIFEPTFIRGVRKLYLEAFMEAHSADPGLDSKFPLETLFEEATDLLEEIRRNPAPPDYPVDPGFVLSFAVYPVAVAHVAIGFYHAQMYKYSTEPMEKIEHSRKAGKAHMEAGRTYPQDDEEHAIHLTWGLQQMFRCGISIKLANEIATAIQRAMPNMQKIWAISPHAKMGRDKTIEWTLNVVDNQMKLVKQGKKTMQDLIVLTI